MNITENESIFCQALATTAFITELSNSEFFKSDYYKKMNFQNNNEIIKIVLEKSGIGNPATMQMFLYVLLVMPKEMFDRFDSSYINRYTKEINELCIELVESSTKSSYFGEDCISNINYYKHIRNAVSHSRCFYKKIGDMCYVEFCDINIKNKDENCQIVIKTSNVGVIMEKLQKQLMELINMEINKRM